MSDPSLFSGPGAPPAHYARVAVERSIDLADGLTYASDEPLAPGDAVQVPLGRGNTPARGIVVAAGGEELLAGFDPLRVKSIAARLPVSLTHELLELASWLARYYACPVGMVLAGMLPASVKQGVGKRTEIRLDLNPDRAPEPDLASLTPSARKAWQAIQANPQPFPATRPAMVAALALPNAGPLNRLLDAGLLVEIRVQTVRSSQELWASDDPAPPPSLTPGQERAVEGIASTLDRFAVHLLRGVTGSGKTEVYLRLIDRVLDAGRSALVLVPEIALTPQTARRFLDRFGPEQVAVMHSALAASARHRAWKRVREGEARVVIGPRSAVFAPLCRPGLIVVDEEHDTSFKQDRLPRYHARDVAIKLAQLAGCPAVLGSATPSLESWANAKRGTSTLWELPTRATAAKMPAVRIVDLTKERRARAGEQGQRLAFETVGPTLAQALEQELTTGGQAMLLLNRRGFASYVACPDAACGWILGCDACDSSMVAHRSSRTRPGYVRCHHCLAEKLIPKACPVCNKRVIELGAGTQRVEREIESRFGTTLGLIEGETFARVDADTMNTARDYADTLDRFARGDLRLLLGTQMIAKGLDFPGVGLVGVLNADTAASLPDFRASERTYQLVSQVAGRAGRGERPGLVIVQTVNPEDPALLDAARHDHESFARREWTTRRTAGLPPARRMARIVIRDANADTARAHADALARALRDLGQPDRGPNALEIIGPAPCVIARVAERYRFAVDLLAPSARTIQDAIADLRRRGLLKADTTTAIDVDPVALL
ncbi:MAG: primosomal protein N' [Planctomycetota bacterium]